MKMKGMYQEQLTMVTGFKHKFGPLISQTSFVGLKDVLKENNLLKDQLMNLQSYLSK